MLRIKRYAVGVVIGLASFVFLCCTAHAYSVDSVANGGYSEYNAMTNPIYSWELSPFLKISGYKSGALTTYTVSSAISDKAAAIAYGNSLGFDDRGPSYTYDWWYTSAGTFGASGQIGMTVTGLAPGTYKIQATGGGFTYDNWNWTDSSTYSVYRYFLGVVQTTGGIAYQQAAIGDKNVTSTGGISGLASHYAGWYDIVTIYSLSDVLTFYVCDNNTMDNSGTLSFDITSVPLPSSLLLALSGLPAMALFRVRRFFSKK